MSYDEYYEVKKSQFKALIKKDSDENVQEFLIFVQIEMMREMTGTMNSLKFRLGELEQAIYSQQ
ncbi:hypothetical protein [Flavobacterium cerinum]|uniref:Uncharacterized protein n=1 Tax=Flavobacterium cerinum TaxID=2502784 RepID=A0A444HF20_9FLAO|nr:hypothetical protein [Flavobacterium cerinum]RWX03566.1 hypothetical protein EPI11_01155 [Flavobacterium cerinum]